MRTAYNNQQRIFSLSTFSNLASLKLGTKEALQTALTKEINEHFANKKIKALIGEWKTVWGPVVYKSPKELLNVSSNAMYVAVNKDKSQYVVAVSGTNGISSFGWLTEDFKIGNMKKWKHADIKGKELQISEGTNIGLDILLNDMKSNGQTILQFLKSISNNTAEVVTTGHSLGGALSAVLALAFHDTQSQWNYNNNLRISCLTSAGATPGNTDFSNYYNDVLGTNTIRVWNRLDIVPHAWQIDMLQAIPSIYFPYRNSGKLIPILTNLAITQSIKGSGILQKNPYLQLLPQTPGLSGQVDLSLVVPPSTILKMVTTLLTTILPKTKLPKKVIEIINNVLIPILKNIPNNTTLINLIEIIETKIQHLIEATHINYIFKLLNWLYNKISKFSNFMIQSLHQHVNAYFMLLNIEDLYDIIKSKDKNKDSLTTDPLKIFELLVPNLTDTLKKIIPLDFLENHEPELHSHAY